MRKHRYDVPKIESSSSVFHMRLAAEKYPLVYDLCHPKVILKDGKHVVTHLGYDSERTPRYDESRNFTTLAKTGQKHYN